MKGILGLLRPKNQAVAGETNPESRLFATTSVGPDAGSNLLVPWEARAVEVGASTLDPERGTHLLQTLWAKDKYMQLLDHNAIARMGHYFDFATVAANRDLIRQDELGTFMLVLLSGSIAVDRLQPWGERLRLTEAVPGEILGEMSLLDGGSRFSVCTTLSDCEIAVLGAEAMDEMLNSDPALTANLVALLARKLSLRLRAVSARLSEQN
jgi:hypothetical protein